jgi:hypothetical protein
VRSSTTVGIRMRRLLIGFAYEVEAPPLVRPLRQRHGCPNVHGSFLARPAPHPQLLLPV